MTTTQHPTALVENSVLGEDTSIGAYCTVRGASLAEGVTVASGCCLQGPLNIARGVHIGARACLDARPDQPIYVKEQARIGAGAVIAPGVSIGERAVIEVGAVVVRNVPANAVVAGNPARIVRYVATGAAPILAHDTANPVTGTTLTGVTLHHLPLVEDLRGNLSFGEVERHVPFPVKRYFLTFDVVNEETRGEHAHRKLHQFLVCVHGRLHILADDGHHREEFVLDRPNVALHLPPLVWGVQYRFSPSAVLMVLCSDYYDPADYIRDYAEFLAVVGAGPAD